MSISAGHFSILEHSGDMCSPEKIDIKYWWAWLGSMSWGGFHCPVAKGPAKLTLGVELSSHLPTWFSNVQIKTTGTSPNGDSLICVSINPAPNEQFPWLRVPSVFATSRLPRGGFNMKWNDCGGNSARGHVTSLTPNFLPLGHKTAFSASGNFDEDVSGGRYRMQIDSGPLSLLDHHGDICSSENFEIRKFWVWLGTMSWGGFNCPIHKGAAGMHIGALLSSSTPSWISNVKIRTTATTRNGDQLLCVEMEATPSSEEIISV